MGIVWEAYHKGVPLLGVPGTTLDTRIIVFLVGNPCTPVYAAGMVGGG